MSEKRHRVGLRIFAPLAVLTSSIVASAGDPQSKPNILFIYADDLGWGDVGFNGRRDWTTPHLDRLAAQGTVFTRWYTGAVVCAPSRGVLLTGKYTIHNGVTGNGDDLPRGQMTLAEALHAQGYATAIFGKWHTGRPRDGGKPVHPMDIGFDEYFGFYGAAACWEKFPKQLAFGRRTKQVDGYASTLFTDASIDFLRRQKDRPFFLYVPYTDPHFNIDAPPEDVALYRGKFKEKDPDKPLNATYAAMVSRMDKEIGRLLAALDEQGLTERTLVIFTSDHGATFEIGNQGTAAFHDSNHPFRGQKRTLWEGGIRVPALVRWPGKVPAGQTSPEIVHMMDVFPTVLAAIGASPQGEWKVDGANMLPVWMGKARAPERTLFWEWRSEGTDQLAAMRGDLKLVVPCTGTSKPELYNVETDPGERRDLSAEQPELVKKLNQELDAWRATETRKPQSSPK